MTFATHLPVIFGAAFSLMLTATYLHPRALVNWLEGQPTAQALGWDSQKVEAAKDARLSAFLRQAAVAQRRFTCEVMQGKCTLLEAAAGFQLLKATKRSLSGHRAFNGRHEPVELCEDVIRWVQVEGASTNNPETARILSRLNAELQRARSRPNAIVLPVVPRGILATLLREPVS